MRGPAVWIHRTHLVIRRAGFWVRKLKAHTERNAPSHSGGRHHPCTSITAMVPFIIVPLKQKGLVWQGAMLGDVPLAGVAQLVEHLICNQRVRGSNPFASSRESAFRNFRV